MKKKLCKLYKKLNILHITKSWGKHKYIKYGFTPAKKSFVNYAIKNPSHAHSKYNEYDYILLNIFMTTDQ